MPRKPKRSDAVSFEAASFEAVAFDGVSFEAPSSADPLSNVEYTGDPEEDSKRELSAMEAGFIERAKNEEKRRIKATDSEYWVCLCFQSREQVEEFLRNSGWGRTSDKYLDGQKVAAKAGIALTPDTAGFGRTHVDRKLSEMAL